MYDYQKTTVSYHAKSGSSATVTCITSFRVEIVVVVVVVVLVEIKFWKRWVLTKDENRRHTVFQLIVTPVRVRHLFPNSALHFINIVQVVTDFS